MRVRNKQVRNGTFREITSHVITRTKSSDREFAVFPGPKGDLVFKVARQKADPTEKADKDKVRQKILPFLGDSKVTTPNDLKFVPLSPGSPIKRMDDAGGEGAKKLMSTFFPTTNYIKKGGAICTIKDASIPVLSAGTTLKGKNLLTAKPDPLGDGEGGFKVCSKCGHILNYIYNYCGRCGSRVN